MTLEEFFIALDAHEIKFERKGKIRTVDGECPLCALANRITGKSPYKGGLTIEYPIAMNVLELSYKDSNLIINAADSVPIDPEASKVRDQLFMRFWRKE